jgi:inner membrane protein
MLRLFRNSALTKIFMLLAVLLVLSVPLAQIGSLIEERGRSQEQAAVELAATYAGPQTLIGPLLAVPYVERWTTEEERPVKIKARERDDTEVEKTVLRLVRTSHARERVHIVFPTRLDVQGTLAPQERYRGIFTVPFYTLQARLAGSLPPFDPAAVPHAVKDSTLEFAAPVLALALGDVRGIEGAPQLVAAGEALRFGQRIPGASAEAWLAAGVHAPLSGAALQAFEKRQPLPFELRLGLIGQRQLAIAPVADETTAQLKSAWPHPSFGGRFLAANRVVSPEGFDARWAVSSLVSSARAQITGAESAGARERPASLDTFDVTLAQPLNVYAQSNRAIKYGALFVGLVLMTTFMFELLRSLRMHPVQYGLVGLSIALFFLLLLALSEKMDFWKAYAGGAAASVVLLSIYFSAVLRGWRRGAALGGFVALLYAALYGLLASENNALLLGSLLLFAMLAALMIATRRVDWYALGGSASAGVSTPSTTSGGSATAAAGA